MNSNQNPFNRLVPNIGGSQDAHERKHAQKVSQLREQLLYSFRQNNNYKGIKTHG